jgi:hypothetical protein
MRIADLMKQIANWMPDVRERKMSQVRAIAEYNKKHFFSQEFFNKITEELKINLAEAVTKLHLNNTSNKWLEHWNKIVNIPEIYQYLMQNHDQLYPTIDTVNRIKSIANNHYRHSLTRT